MKMTAYNNLKIAILAILASQSIHAITIDPVQVQSAPGELLYAEMNFQQSNVEVPLQVSLASNEDLLSLGGAAQQAPAHLNFFVRRNQTGNGVITITSTQPISASELNLVLRIQEGNATQLKRVKTSLKQQVAAQPKIQPNPHEKPLAPIRIVNERDIALDLPMTASTKQPPAMENKAEEVKTPEQTPPAAPPEIKAEVPVKSQRLPLPPGATVASMGGTTIVTTIRGGNQSQAQTKVVHSVVQAAPIADSPTPAAAVTAKNNPKVETKPTVSAQKTTQATTAKAQYVVQSKDTLWSIASKIAQQQKRPIQEVLQEIQSKNAKVFENRSIDRLQLGMVLDLDVAPQTDKKQKVPTQAAHRDTQPSTATSNKAAPKSKYRLNDAEMSLVAQPKEKVAAPTAQETAKAHALTPNIMTARQKSVTLQKNVTQLELALNKKDNRIQMLNSRLAQLQQQLQAQQAKQKPSH